ncbi:ribonuclease R [Rhodocyclus tenuis]|uniref:ribonuclease R n=1 Tax=Rhodocyclus gracilis TaxID=2929842 RepID=UPI001298BD6A|nr:ribonuclease R [Rhodocyclus gracilis]MRD73816.1 ribonuclease R [Rhodocyclus gracilis]
MSIKKLSKVRKADPFFARESERYEYPLPSREYILQRLEEEGAPATFEHLCAVLDIADDEVIAFQRRLGAMEREAQLMRNRKGAYIVPERASLIAGRIEGHPDGFGFLVPDDGGADLFLEARQMSKVLHGDRALARVVGVDRKGRREGVIVEVLERANSRVVGRVIVEHGITVVVPENRRISQDILVPPEKKAKARAQPGQVVMVEIIEQPSRHAQPIGRIVEVLGNYADPGMEIEIALRKHELPFEFDSESLAETKALPAKVRKVDTTGRVDLRDLPLVTIDGETAKDFDDAVYAEKRGKGKNAGWRLVVAIADVSHYVRPGSALDRGAKERGNSVYFPRRVIPMLPEKLSNGLCSLNPEVDRLAMVCDMQVSAKGTVDGYRFYPAVFRSAARLTYTQVWDWLSQAATPENATQQSLLPHLTNLYALYQALAKARTQRGAIDFETTETMMLFDDQGKIANIVPVHRNEAHRLIEECMLAANVCASAFLEEHKQPCLYRVHQGPTPEKLEGLRNFLKEFGLGLDGGESPSASDYAALLEKIKPRPDAQLLQTVMLRSLRQAMYSPDNVGHFGLAYERYAHFTSPIRRYPDLLVHRAIKATLAGERLPVADWDDIGLHCSMTERRADEATRDVSNWLKCFYMKERIGEEFDGTIAAVTHFGVFVALDQVYVEGLVHVSELGEDYFQFDATRHQMLGERSGRRYRLGDRLRVKLVRSDLETGRIDFVLAATPANGQMRQGKSAGSAPASVSSHAQAPSSSPASSSSPRKQVSRRSAGTTPSSASPAKRAPTEEAKPAKAPRKAPAKAPAKAPGKAEAKKAAPARKKAASGAPRQAAAKATSKAAKKPRPAARKARS